MSQPYEGDSTNKKLPAVISKNAAGGTGVWGESSNQSGGPTLEEASKTRCELAQNNPESKLPQISVKIPPVVPCLVPSTLDFGAVRPDNKVGGMAGVCNWPRAGQVWLHLGRLRR